MWYIRPLAVVTLASSRGWPMSKDSSDFRGVRPSAEPRAACRGWVERSDHAHGSPPLGWSRCKSGFWLARRPSCRSRPASDSTRRQAPEERQSWALMTVDGRRCAAGGIFRFARRQAGRGFGHRNLGQLGCRRWSGWAKTAPRCQSKQSQKAKRRASCGSTPPNE